MDCGSQILHLLFLFLLIIFFLLSFHCAHLLIATGTATLNEEGRNSNHGREFYLGNGKNGNEEEKGLQRFRFLLELESYFQGKSRDAHPQYDLLSSPLPSPSPSPSPLPVHVYPHQHHHPSYHPHLIPKAQNIRKPKRGKSKRIIIAAAVSGGVGSLLCAFGLIFGCKKLRKKRKKTARTISIYCSEPSGPDLFYLESIGAALEPQPFCIKQNQNIPHCDLTPRAESEPEEQKFVKSEVEEINSAGEIAPQTLSSDNAIPESESESDDESFHSLCNSQSSEHVRTSNASAESCVEFLDIICSNDSKEPVFPMTSSPPPPPPPPPLPLMPPPPPQQPQVSYLHKTPSPSRKTLPISDSSLGSNGTLQSNLSPATPKPPPPPPPPFGNGNCNSLKVPPPPPSQLSQIIPLGKDGSPLPKLKPLHWDKVRATPDRSTVWDKLRSSSFEFDEEMIESLFGYNLQNTLKNDEVMKTKTPSPSKHVLEPKRLQNITILSKALNVTAEQVCEALLRGSGLTLQELEALAKMVPTKEEEAKLSNYKGDCNELGSAEKFVKAMLKIPFSFSRIEAMLFRETFDDEVIHLRKSFSMLQEACKELRSSRLFLKLLEAVLKTGNRMNIGTIRGGARAFKLDTLLKLADVKGTDGRTTLLHFVVQEIVRSEGFRVSESIMGKINQISSRTHQDKEEDYTRMGLDLVSGLSTELCNVKKTATIDLDVLATSVSNLSDGMAKTRRLLEKDLAVEEKNGNFVHSMTSFLSHAEMNLKGLQENENSVLLQVREITEYFHGDVSKEESNPLRIFVIVRDFLGMLDHVCKELRSSKASSSSPNPLAPFRT